MHIGPQEIADIRTMRRIRESGARLKIECQVQYADDITTSATWGFSTADNFDRAIHRLLDNCRVPAIHIETEKERKLRMARDRDARRPASVRRKRLEQQRLWYERNKLRLKLRKAAHA